MDITENFQFPYPECDPPLTKDDSNIKQLRDLAEAVDAAVQDFNDRITDRLIRPPSVRLSNAGAPLVSTVTDNVISFDTLLFDNQPGNAQTDLVNGVVRIVRDGWYLLGSWCNSQVATDVQTRIRFLVNGTPATNFQGPSGLDRVGNQDVTAAEMLFLRTGDGIGVQTRMGSPGTSVTYTVHIWSQLVVEDANG